jgi:hypothetical protein
MENRTGQFCKALAALSDLVQAVTAQMHKANASGLEIDLRTNF